MLGINWILLSKERQFVNNVCHLKMFYDHIFFCEHFVGALSDIFPGKRKQRKQADMKIVIFQSGFHLNCHVGFVKFLNDFSRENVRECTHKMFTEKNMVMKHFEVT